MRQHARHPRAPAPHRTAPHRAGPRRAAPRRAALPPCQRRAPSTDGRPLRGAGWLEHDLCGTGPNEGEWACLPGILKALGIVPRPGPQRYATFVGGTMIVRASAITRGAPPTFRANVEVPLPPMRRPRTDTNARPACAAVPLHAYWRLLHAHLDPTEVGCAWPDGEPWTSDRKSPASRIGYAMELTWRAIWSCERCTFKPLRRRGLFTCGKHPGRGWSPQRSYATGSRYYSEEWYAAHAAMSLGSTV